MLPGRSQGLAFSLTLTSQHSKEIGESHRYESVFRPTTTFINVLHHFQCYAYVGDHRLLLVCLKVQTP